MSALNLLAEAILRVEHKLDAVLRKVSMGSVDLVQPMHFVGQTCPVCSQFIDYTVDVQNQIVVRRCGCKTGKIPSTIPLIPVGEVTNGHPTTSADSEGPGAGAEESDRSKAR